METSSCLILWCSINQWEDCGFHQLSQVDYMILDRNKNAASTLLFLNSLHAFFSHVVEWFLFCSCFSFHIIRSGMIVSNTLIACPVAINDMFSPSIVVSLASSSFLQALRVVWFRSPFFSLSLPRHVIPKSVFSSWRLNYSEREREREEIVNLFWSVEQELITTDKMFLTIVHMQEGEMPEAEAAAAASECEYELLTHSCSPWTRREWAFREEPKKEEEGTGMKFGPGCLLVRGNKEGERTSVVIHLSGPMGREREFFFLEQEWEKDEQAEGNK